MYKILAKCLVIVVLCNGVSTAQEDIEPDVTIVEPRNFISRDTDSFSKRSEWEGVWGEVSLCDPLNKIGWCYKQSALQIYDCYQINEYNYEDKSAICTLGLAMRQILDPANPTEDLICDSGARSRVKWRFS